MEGKPTGVGGFNDMGGNAAAETLVLVLFLSFFDDALATDSTLLLVGILTPLRIALCACDAFSGVVPYETRASRAALVESIVLELVGKENEGRASNNFRWSIFDSIDKADLAIDESNGLEKAGCARLVLSSLRVAVSVLFMRSDPIDLRHVEEFFFRVALMFGVSETSTTLRENSFIGMSSTDAESSRTMELILRCRIRKMSYSFSAPFTLLFLVDNGEEKFSGRGVMFVLRFTGENIERLFGVRFVWRFELLEVVSNSEEEIARDFEDFNFISSTRLCSLSIVTETPLVRS
mmetsp:Transcript_5946/g.7271  ORF Transcript_5946/g.7271 Transcript_5946/m.7271 type:complete len:292 (-) Transcript_5946:816-1691(-)